MGCLAVLRSCSLAVLLCQPKPSLNFEDLAKVGGLAAAPSFIVICPPGAIRSHENNGFFSPSGEMSHSDRGANDNKPSREGCRGCRGDKGCMIHDLRGSVIGDR
jgi:hypothetical protein